MQLLGHMAVVDSALSAPCLFIASCDRPSYMCGMLRMPTCSCTRDMAVGYHPSLLPASPLSSKRSCMHCLPCP